MVEVIVVVVMMGMVVVVVLIITNGAKKRCTSFHNQIKYDIYSAKEPNTV